MSKQQTAVDFLWNELKAYNVNIASDLVAQFNQAKQMEMEQMKEYADYAIKQLHETGICFYDEYGNLEDVKGGDHE
jgi:hypothetical protein